MAVALTTEDNPFNPITDFDRWKAFDEQSGYFSSQYLARLVKIDDSMSDDQIEDEIEQCVDRICALNLTGNYKKVKM
jgi:hypothetical protein